MDVILQAVGPLQGTLTLPPDKAICHRALLCAALAEGRTRIHPWPSGDDCQRTLHVVEGLGARVVGASEGREVEGRGGAGLIEPAAPLECGESGTTFRLTAGVLAGQPFVSLLRAGEGLSRRPMRRIIEPLTRMGAVVQGTAFGGGSGGDQESHPPLRIQGVRPLRAIRYEMPVASAQVKSAVLFAALAANAPSEIVEARPTRDHAERMLRAFGVPVVREGRAIRLTPGPLRAPGEVVLPGDFSSAAFFLVAACLVPGSLVTLQGIGLNPTRTGLLDVLARMGARIRVAPVSERGECFDRIDLMGCQPVNPAQHRGEPSINTPWSNHEPFGDITAEAGELHAADVGPDEVPGLIDELPILMVAAACARGTTRLSGIGELRVKETDRIRSMTDGLLRLGARVRLVGPDGVEIEGGASLRGGVVDSRGDHRTAMSLAVAGLLGRGATTLRDGACVSKSFPEFFEVLRGVAGGSSVKTVDSTRAPLLE